LKKEVLEYMRTIALAVNALDKSIYDLHLAGDKASLNEKQKALTQKVLELECLREESETWFDNLPRYQQPLVLMYYMLGSSRDNTLKITGLSIRSFQRINQEVMLELAGSEVNI
jgi:hypothetical protein